MVRSLYSESGDRLPLRQENQGRDRLESSAVASAIDGDLGDAIDAGKLTSADVVTIIDEANLPSFSSLDFSCYPTKSHIGEGIKLMKTDKN
jgi:hypothetical protein